MCPPDCDSETMRVARAAQVIARAAARVRETALAAAGSPHRAAPHPPAAGYRVVRPGRPDIYLVDPAGYRRKIPNHTTYNRLFRNWRGIVDTHDLDEIAEGPPLRSGTLLVRGDASSEIYLLDEGHKRLLVGESVLDKYWFDETRVCLIRQLLIDHVPAGEAWE
jgi:hypothetical protein